jgi:hypothetical protein
MAPSSRPLCADISREADEPLGATASRVEHWLLVEYSGRWSRDVLGGSALPAGAKEHLREQLASLPHARLLFVRRPDRRAVSERHVYAVRSGASSATAYRAPIGEPDDLASIDVAAVLHGAGEVVDHPLLVVCTHGKRDRCCARYGRPLYDELRRAAPPGWVWQSTHVGGDRFAGNLVCLPEGLYFGRVGPDDARKVLAEYQDGRIMLERYRGRSCHSFPQQAAERVVRERTGRREIDGVRFVSMQREGAHVWTVRFRAGGDELAARVVREEGEPRFLTCDAETPRRPRRFVATLA